MFLVGVGVKSKCTHNVGKLLFITFFKTLACGEGVPPPSLSTPLPLFYFVNNLPSLMHRFTSLSYQRLWTPTPFTLLHNFFSHKTEELHA